MPIVLGLALLLNALMVVYRVSDQGLRLLVLSASFPVGFVLGRLVYLRRSHVEIAFDDISFQVSRGRKTSATGKWRDYRLVSLAVDEFGRLDLRLYKSIGGDYTLLPISRTNAEPQRLRDHVQILISRRKVSNEDSNPRVVEAA